MSKAIGNNYLTYPLALRLVERIQCRVLWLSNCKRLPPSTEEQVRLAVSLITFAILASGPAYAKHWHEDEKHWKEHGKHEDQDDRGFDHRDHGAKSCYFQPRDARIVTAYYAPRYRALPPGLQMKLYRSGRLPPGWQNKIEPLPVVVERQLAPVPSGYSRGYINGYAVVYSPRTQVVIDIVAVFGR
jgi:hypothetical protein